MSLLIGFLTFILFVNCLFLVLLVLIQLPKKEAGAGLAFGGGATDALFGAGTGNALTKMTKYAATSFLALALVLTILNTKRAGSSIRFIESELARRAASNNVPAGMQQVTPVATNQGLKPLVSTNTALDSAPSANTNLIPLNTAPAPAGNPGTLQPLQPAGNQANPPAGEQPK